MQLALVDMQRRVQGRVPLPWIRWIEWLRSQQAAGRRSSFHRHPARME